MELKKFLEAKRPRVSERTIRRYVHDWNRWKRYHSKNFNTARAKMLADGLSPKTIESTLNTVKLVVGDSGRYEYGERLRIPRPSPTVPTTEEIGAIYKSCDAVSWRSPDWLRSLIVLTCWTGCRLNDLPRLKLRKQWIYLQAGKTGKAHLFPVLPFVARHWKQIELTQSKRQLYDSLRLAADKAGAPYCHPKSMRRYAVTQWCAADSMAGRLLHGAGIGVLDHYVDARSVLQAASHRVKMPDAFYSEAEKKGRKDREKDIVKRFRRATPKKRKAIHRLVKEIT